jgi:hypothetical protein
VSQWTHLRYSLKAGFGFWPLRLHDAIQNRRFANAEQRFLVVRHPSKNPHFYNVLLRWLERRLPEVRARFELRTIPFHLRTGSRYVLHVPWLQDPVQRWSPSAFRQANQLAAECDERHIPIINRVDRLTNAIKSTGARLIASVGIRTPKMVQIDNPQQFRETRGGLNLPLLVREDWGHGGLVFRVETADEVRKLPLERFSHPVAVEFVDVKSQHDGLYRKYRYVAAGDLGIAHRLHVGKHWKVKGTGDEYSPALCDEELAYTSGLDPNHRQLQAARQALGLDFVAFDYSYDPQGELIVWEANPYPHIYFPGPASRRPHRRTATIRTLAAMVHLYLRRVGLAVPSAIEDLLADPSNAHGC